MIRPGRSGLCPAGRTGRDKRPCRPVARSRAGRCSALSPPPGFRPRCRLRRQPRRRGSSTRARIARRLRAQGRISLAEACGRRPLGRLQQPVRGAWCERLAGERADHFAALDDLGEFHAGSVDQPRRHDGGTEGRGRRRRTGSRGRGVDVLAGGGGVDPRARRAGAGTCRTSWRSAEMRAVRRGRPWSRSRAAMARYSAGSPAWRPGTARCWRGWRGHGRGGWRRAGAAARRTARGRAGRVAQPQPGLAVLVAGEVTGGQPQDAGERLGVEQQQAGGGAGPDRDSRVGGETSQQAEPALLGDDLPGGGAWRGCRGGRGCGRVPAAGSGRRGRRAAGGRGGWRSSCRCRPG